MCGHAGLIINNPNDFHSAPQYRLTPGAKTNVAADIAAQLLYESQAYRGGDGFGVMAMSTASVCDPTTDSDVKTSFVKEVGNFGGKWDTVIDSGKVFTCKGVICMHARKMTAGTKIYAATHPIHVGHITLMHNGSVPNWQRIFPNAGSDTIGIAQMLSTDGIKTVAETVEGAKTLVWLDDSDKSLNFFKHKERPLYMCRTGSSMIYASEKWMVFKAADIYNLPIEEWFEFEDGCHYKFNTETGEWSEPVKYDEPTTAFNWYGKKKEEQSATEVVSVGTQVTKSGAETTVTTMTVLDTQSTTSLLRNTEIVIQLQDVQKDANMIVVTGRLVNATSNPVHSYFEMKRVVMRLPIAMFAIIEKLTVAGAFLVTKNSTHTHHSAASIMANVPHGIAVCFDKTMTEAEFDSLEEALTNLYNIAANNIVLPSTLASTIRQGLEYLDLFRADKTCLGGVPLVPHKQRINCVTPATKIDIPYI